jgi:CO/xanthine dehydrogenase FAD-binding subunit
LTPGIAEGIETLSRAAVDAAIVARVRTAIGGTVEKGRQFVADVQWFFPRTLAEVAPLLAQEGVIPHGGGTGILRGGMGHVRGLIDLGRLGLDGVRRDKTVVSIGAAASYSAVARAVSSWDPQHVLARSLAAAATTSLRNRITIGGSIALFPYWSDLMGPLLATDAEVQLVGSHEGWVPVADYVRRRELRQGSLITEVRWREEGWTGEYRRWTRTKTDRPAFSLTVLAGKPGKAPEGLRILLVGCSGRFRRLTEVEEAVAKGSSASAAAAGAEIEIPGRMGAGGDYLSHCARVELERALAALLGTGRKDTGRGR